MIKKIYRVIITVCVFILVLRFVNWEVKRSHPLPAPPQPNGYTELVAAAQSLKPLPTDLSELGTNEIIRLAGQNLPALERVRKALQMECRVPLKASKAWDDEHFDDLSQLKRLAIAFGIESRALFLQGQTNDSARCDVETLRLADAFCRGGLLVDGITSLAVETIGLANLQGKIAKLDATACREFSLALEDLLAHREKPEAILATEKNWSLARFGLVGVAGDLLTGKDLAKRKSQFVIRSREVAAKTQRLMLRLGARAYELDHQHSPAGVADLMPDYLKAIPRDLETGKEIQEIPPLVN